MDEIFEYRLIAVDCRFAKYVIKFVPCGIVLYVDVLSGNYFSNDDFLWRSVSVLSARVL